jgi:arylsulfatase A-like enzyme
MAPVRNTPVNDNSQGRQGPLLVASASAMTVGLSDLLLGIQLDRYPFAGFSPEKYGTPAVVNALLGVVSTALVCFVGFLVVWYGQVAKARRDTHSAIAVATFAGAFLFLSIASDLIAPGLLFVAGALLLSVLLLPLRDHLPRPSWPVVACVAPCAGLLCLLALHPSTPTTGLLLYGFYLLSVLSALGVHLLTKPVAVVDLTWLWSLLPAGLGGMLGVVWLMRLSREPGTWAWVVSIAAVLLPLCGWLSRKRVSGSWLVWSHRAHILVWAIVPLFVAGLSLPPREPEAPKQGASDDPKQVILVTIDSLRADALSSAPNIRSLAGQSSSYARAISASSWTLPAVASLLTGVNPDVHQMTSEATSLSESFVTLAEHYRQAGYRTAALVSNPYLAEQSNLQQGFDEYHALTPEDFWLPVGQTIGTLLLDLLRQQGVTPAGMHQRLKVDSSGLTDLAIQWLGKHQQRNFFLWVHYLDPHTPYTPPEAFLPQGAVAPRFGYEMRNSSILRSGFPPLDAVERAWVRELYLGEVRYVDACVGRLLDALRSLGIFERSLLAVTSDHGEEFWEHGGFYHGHSLYQELTHVPLLIKASGDAPPRRVDRMVSTTSLMSELLRRSGLPVAPELRGAIEILSDRGPETGVLSSGHLFGDDLESIILDSNKLIRSRIDGREQLFNLETDPEERYPLQEPATSQDLESALRAHKQRFSELRGLLSPEGGQGVAPDADTMRALKSLGYTE